MRISINSKEQGAPLGDLFGIFFEDLNHAADGGMYGELVQNRSFEFAPIDNPFYHPLTAWEKVENDGEAKLVVETGAPISHKNPHYLAIDVMIPGTDVGVQNTGFNTGISLYAGHGYRFKGYFKREQDLEAPVHVSLRSKEGHIYTEKSILVTQEWQKYEWELEAPVTDTSARLAITVQGRGKVYLDFISLFPVDTFMGRKNGMRKDIAQLLADMKPKFMRFPGGCLVHDGSLDPDARDSQYRWKNTIGPLEERPARRSNWIYNQTLGIGFYEYFQLAEDLGAKPIPVLPAGYDPHHHREAPLDKLQPWIDDALDLIEFANGGVDTVWGAKRAEMGHPEPFHLEYLAIGNEEVGEPFFERYRIIHKAVHEKHPEIQIIGTSGPNAAGSEFERGWDWSRRTGTDIVDEHYYQAPEWFLANHHRYDSYDRQGPKVFLGEYATWGNTWWNALVEASYMIGLERNAEAVSLACYAPMLCNVDYVNWKPDMIWFDNHRVFGTANYYVQKLFMNHQGDVQIPVHLETIEEPEMLTEDPSRIAGQIGLSRDDTTVLYSQIAVMNEDTGEIRQYADQVIDSGHPMELLGEMDWVNYTLRMKARELDGYKGFKLLFGYQDEENHYSWVVGGWQNQDTFISERIHGRGVDMSQSLLSVDKDREYDLELKVRGRYLETWVDGVRYHAVDHLPVVAEPLYTAASRDTETGDLILKVVNVQNVDKTAQIQIEGRGESLQGTKYEMAGYALEAVNSLDEPYAVSPEENEFAMKNGEEYTFPPSSITIIRIGEN